MEYRGKGTLRGRPFHHPGRPLFADPLDPLFRVMGVLNGGQRVGPDPGVLVGGLQAARLKTPPRALGKAHGRLEPAPSLAGARDRDRDQVRLARTVSVRKAVDRQDGVGRVDLRVAVAGLAGGLAEASRMREWGIAQVRARVGWGSPRYEEGGPDQGRPPARSREPSGHVALLEPVER